MTEEIDGENFWATAEIAWKKEKRNTLQGGWVLVQKWRSNYGSVRWLEVPVLLPETKEKMG